MRQQDVQSRQEEVNNYIYYYSDSNLKNQFNINKMLDFQTIAAIIFVLVLSLILYLNRKKLETSFLVPYLVYFSMYKTKLGLKLMDSLSKN